MVIVESFAIQNLSFQLLMVVRGIHRIYGTLYVTG